MLEGLSTIGSLRCFQMGKTNEGERTKRQKVSNEKKRGRHITWNPNGHY